MRAPGVAGLVVAVVTSAGCGLGWFDVPNRPHRGTVAECAPVPADQRVLTFHGVTLEPICEDVLVDPATSSAERAYLQRMYVVAIQHNLHFYGRLLALRPLTVLCRSEACARYFVGDMHASVTIPPNAQGEGAEYVGDERRTIVLTHTDHIGHVLAHELSHAELLYRSGAVEGPNQPVPAWFNEGLASLVGDDPACGPEVPRDPVSLASLRHQDDWNHFTQIEAHGEGTYCAARDEVSAWFDAHGRDGLVDLLRRVRAGDSFDSLYGPMARQPATPSSPRDPPR